MRQRCLCLTGCLWVLPALAAVGESSADRKKVEITAAPGVHWPSLDTTYSNQYEPPFSPTAISSSASQTLSLAAQRKAGLTLGFAYLPVEKLGVQILFDTVDAPVDGASTPYEVALDYIARPPPDYVPRINHYGSTRDWPDPEGGLKSTVFSGNLLLSTGGDGIRGAVSGGLSVFRTRATVQSLGYTTFWLGGHSVLFMENYELEFETDPVTKLGLNVGVELSIPLGRHAAFAIDGRYYYAPPASAGIHFSEILNLDEIAIRQSLDAIQTRVGPVPIEIDPSFFRVGLGLKLRF